MPLRQVVELSPEIVLTGVGLVCALVVLGLGIGVLTGLFGVGGAFLLNPLLIVLLGVNESVVVGSSLCFTIGAAATGMARHMRSRNVELRAMIVIGAGAVFGAVLGAWAHEGLRAGLAPVNFKPLILSLYLVLLLLTAWLVFRKSGAREEQRPRRSLLQRLPLGPRVDLPAAGLARVSLPGLLVVGLTVGAANGLLGIGGGVLLMPLLLVVVGLSVHQAVGTSLGVVLFSSVAGTIKHSLVGNVSLWIAMSLLVGGTVGVHVGAWIFDRTGASRLRRYFAAIVVLTAVLVAADLAKRLIVR